MITLNLAQHLQPFDQETNVGTSVTTKWKKWLKDFENFIIANGITDGSRKHFPEIERL